MGGKVRVVTLHPAEEVTVARGITALWLRGLRRCVTTRDMLRGRQVVIERQCKRSKLYSADLSAATDYIPHGLAIHVGRKLCELLKRPEDVPIVERILGQKRIGDEDTRNGVHMGLGPSWTVLSLLNGFAAWYAGARKETYQICGDDLTGFWPRKLADKYAQTLERLGLVVNHSKSFYGYSGVFCERRMEVRGDFAVSRDHGHIGALTASKLLAGFSHSTYATLENLESSQLLDCREEVRRTLLPSGIGPGRVANGGNGKGGLRLGGLATLARGKRPLVEAEPLPKPVSDVLQRESAVSGEVSTLDFTIAYRTALRMRTTQGGNAPEEPRRMTRKGFSQLSKLNRNGKQSYEKLITSIRLHSRATSRHKRLALHLATRHRKRLVRSGKVRRRIENVLSRPPARRFISLETCQSLLSEVCHPAWIGRLLEHATSLSQRAREGHRESLLATEILGTPGH
jgi:hypothetical protein